MASTCLHSLSLETVACRGIQRNDSSNKESFKTVKPFCRPKEHLNSGLRQADNSSLVSIRQHLPGGRGTKTGRSRRNAISASSTTAESDPFAGVAVYKPASYDAIIKDVARTVEYGLADSLTRMEVDFPALPTSVSSYRGSSDEFIDANLQLALALARRLRESKGITIKLVVPDQPERRRAARILKSAFQLMGGLSLGTLDDVPGGAAQGFFGSIRNVLDFDFDFNFGGGGGGGGGGEEDLLQSSEPADLYLVLNASTAELPAVERYIDHFVGKSSAILFNLELDTLRADLGLLGFPPKDTHYRFLSQFIPVYYIRTRDYSKSVATAPFILNYSGALLRQYPGPWQVMLKQGDGSYACVAEDAERFTLGQVKEELLISLGLQEEEGSTMAFLRQGYKTTTWWEEDVNLEESKAWRS